MKRQAATMKTTTDDVYGTLFIQCDRLTQLGNCWTNREWFDFAVFFVPNSGQLTARLHSVQLRRSEGRLWWNSVTSMSSTHSCRAPKPDTNQHTCNENAFSEPPFGKPPTCCGFSLCLSTFRSNCAHTHTQTCIECARGFFFSEFPNRFARFCHN